MAVEQMSTLTVGSTTYEINDKVARQQNEDTTLEVTELRDDFDKFSQGGTVEVAPDEPDNEHVNLWVDSDEEETGVNLPEVKDDLVSDVDTWSSQKIKEELDNVSTIQVSEEEPTEEYAKVWINSDNEESFDAAEIKDSIVSSEDTWSSQKIKEEIDKKLARTLEADYANKLLYVGSDGEITVLGIGAGLKIENGVLSLVGAVLDSAALDEMVL